ncbi:MAG: hypothetical protein DRP27_07365 [Thermotogae bacterium]|nr:MAG: hypothetical protein DRP27_07365 [Thermotogota bacterium]
MTLVYERRYPDYDTYRGKAYYCKIAFKTLRTGIPPLDDFCRWVAEKAVEANVALKHGRMLWLKIYRSPSVWGWFIPTWDWVVEWWFHFSTPRAERYEMAVSSALGVPAVVYEIVKLAMYVLLAYAIYASLKEAKEVFWPKEEAPLLAYAALLGAFGLAITPIIIELVRKGG